MCRILVLLCLCLVACASAPPPSAPTQPEPSPEPLASHATRSAPARSGRPLVVTVDDLPLVSARLHPDAAERAAITEALLDALRRHRIRAVGFVTWQKVRTSADRELLARWLAEGHELGNHSLSHLSYTETSTAAYLDDVERARAELSAYVARHGSSLRLFRFPFLREGESRAKLDAMRAYLHRTGQRNLPPSLDTQDWAFEQPWVEARRRNDDEAKRRVGAAYQAHLRSDILAQTDLGDRVLGRQAPQVLLLHANEVGAAQWDRLLNWLETMGFRFAPVDEALADEAYTELPAYVGSHGPGLWDRVRAVRRQDELRTELEQTLHEQAAAWTRGDLNAFVSTYAQDAQFVTPTGITVGRQHVLERYRKRYGNEPGTMGALELKVLDLRLLSGTEVTRTGSAVPGRIHGASVVAHWRLSWPDQPAREGHTVIVWHRTAMGWRIVHDASM